MFYRLAAEGVLLLHLGFILFVVLGAAIVAHWRWLAIIHVPSVAWSIFVELTARVCPLTYAENHLRGQAGLAGYPEGFIEHYLLPIVYPAGLGRQTMFLLAAAVLAINAAAYAWIFLRRRAACRGGA